MVKEQFDDIRELTNEINYDYLTYFIGDTAKKDLMVSIMVWNFFKKIQFGEIKLEEAKKNSRIYLNQIKAKYQNEDLNQKSKKWHLNCFANREKLLLNYLIIILQLYLRLNTKQNMEKDYQ